MCLKRKPNIDYSVAFHVDGGLGKRKATQLKAKQLEARSNHFRFYSLNKRLVSVIGVYLSMILTELFHATGILFRKEKPDIIFSRTFFGYFYILIGKIYGIRIIREVHNEFKDESRIFFKESRVKPVFSSLINFIETRSLTRSDGVIFNNPDLRSYFVDAYNLKPSRTTSVYNGSDPGLFFPEDKTLVRKRLGMTHTDTDKLLMFTGSVVEWHGIEYLVDVFKKLHTSYGQEYYLYIVGTTDTSYHIHLKEMYRDVPNLLFIDKVPAHVARDYINAADVCMVTTAKILISQGSPTKMYDYIACGKPVISQEGVTGYGSVVDEHELGCTVDFMNAEAAAGKIADFFRTADFNRIASHNRHKAVHELNWGTTIENWVRFAEHV